MAKATPKTPAKTAKKTPTPKAKAKASPAVSIEKVSEEALKKLQSLGLDQQLQADMEWCLGSYRTDKNPIGLLETAERALAVFNIELAKKTKGVTAKLITDIKKVLI